MVEKTIRTIKSRVGRFDVFYRKKQTGFYAKNMFFMFFTVFLFFLGKSSVCQEVQNLLKNFFLAFLLHFER